MAILALPFTTPSGVVADAGAQIASLNDVMWAARTPIELVGTVEELQVIKAQIAALEAHLLTELDALDTPKKDLGWGSTADWFTHLAGLRRGQGKRAVDHARQLTADRPLTLAALTEGTISPEQAAVILDAIETMPTTPGLRSQAETLLLEEAGRLNATDLAKAARHVIEIVDPDKAERDAEKALDREDRAAHLSRYLSLTEDGAGGVRLKGRGTVEDAAKLRAALLPLTTPAPALDPDTCADDHDPRDHGARMWDALIDIATHSLTTGHAPESHGARPRVTVTTDLETLRGHLSRHGVTDDGLELSPSAVRRLACDGDIIPVALGTAGEVLDVGRTFRLVTTPLWRALVCRDQHCAFPGCTRPPVMCHGHHIVHWANGGPTSLPNLVLLCGHHHRLIHHSPWGVRINPDDGNPEFQPPPKAGRPRDWIRHQPRRE